MMIAGCVLFFQPAQFVGHREGEGYVPHCLLRRAEDQLISYLSNIVKMRCFDSKGRLEHLETLLPNVFLSQLKASMWCCGLPDPARTPWKGPQPIAF